MLNLIVSISAGMLLSESQGKFLSLANGSANTFKNIIQYFKIRHLTI